MPLAPYTPALYLPGSEGRYRQYPRAVRAIIPGTGYKVGPMVWGEQELNLGSGRYRHGGPVPLLGLGQATTAAQANRQMGWTKAKLKAYWDARARTCQEMGDEGECLAQVARHVPVTIAGLGSYSGLGQAINPQDIAEVASLTARIIANPEQTLRAQGPRVISALDQHIVSPLVDKMAQAAAPYMVRYLLPPTAVLYVLSGLGALFSYQSMKMLMNRKVTANGRRRRRRRR